MIAVSVIVWPTVSVPVVGATVTEATEIGTTVTTAVAVFPSLVAEIVAVPAALAVTRPDASTLAVCGALDVQTIERPLSAFPFASYAMAASDAVAPTETLTVDGVTVSDATGIAVTESVAIAECPSALAAICTVPMFFAVTTPADETTAIVVSELDQ